MIIDFQIGKLKIDSSDISILNKIKKYVGLIYDIKEDHNGIFNWEIIIYTNSPPFDYLSIFKLEMTKGNLIAFEHDIIGYKVSNTNKEYYMEKNGFWFIVFEKCKNKIQLWSVKEELSFDIVRKIIRQIVTYEHKVKGSVFIHSSAVELNNEGFLFCGNKGSGKTTSILNLLSTGKAKYISNDNTIVTKENVLLPILSGLNVGLGSLNNIDRYKEHFKLKDFEESTRKIQIGLDEISTSLGSDISKGVKLAAIFFPNLCLNEKKTVIYSINKSKYVELLSKQLNEYNGHHTDWLITKEVSKVTNNIEELINSVPIFKLDIGSDYRLYNEVILNFANNFKESKKNGI